MNLEQRIVITGMGAVSPVGLNCHETFESLIAGKSGIARIASFDPSHITCQIAGEVKDFEPADYMDRKMARRIGRYAQFSIAATREALSQSGLDLEREDPSRIEIAEKATRTVEAHVFDHRLCAAIMDPGGLSVNRRASPGRP